MAEHKSIEELGEKLELQVEDVPVDLIDPTPGNPNVVPEEMMEALATDIRERGFVQPIVIAPEGERYRLIDGEHRWEIVKGMGLPTIPAVLTDETGDEAMIRTLTINRLRGQFVPLQLAHVLSDLGRRIPEGELRRRLGMTQLEYRDMAKLAGFTDDVGEAVRASVEREKLASPTVLTFVVPSERDASAITRAVESLTTDTLNRGQALARICREWSKETKS